MKKHTFPEPAAYKYLHYLTFTIVNTFMLLGLIQLFVLVGRILSASETVMVSIAFLLGFLLNVVTSFNTFFLSINYKEMKPNDRFKHICIVAFVSFALEAVVAYSLYLII